MSDPTSSDLIRFSRSLAFRDKIRYISADSRCKNVWRLSTTVPSYFPQYKGFSSFLDTETIRVISCILFHQDLSASLRHILGDIQVERLWLLGRAIDAVQAIKCRIAEWPAAAPALLTLADHQHELVGLGDRRTQHFDHIMWYTKAALMLANDHLPADEQLDWNRSEYTLSLYLYLKKEQGVCLCVHREGLNHVSCCATLFKLYSLPIEAWRDANAALFSEADPSTRPRSELRGLMGRITACGYPMLPPTVDHEMHGAPSHPQQIPNAPKAFRYGTISDRLPSAPSGPTTLTSPPNAKFSATPSLPSKQPPNAPRALMFRGPPPASQPGRPPTPQHGQNMGSSSTGRPSVTPNDHTKWSPPISTTPTIQHQLPPRPPTLEPRRYYARSGVYVGRRLAHPLAEAMARPESYSTSRQEHTQHSGPPLNQYMMQLHPPRPVSRSTKRLSTESGASEIMTTSDNPQGGARRGDPSLPPLNLDHTPTPFKSSRSSSVVRRSVEPTSPVNKKAANHDGEQLKRVEKGDEMYSPTRPVPSDKSVSNMVAKSPESGEADMEVDDPDSHLGTILAVAKDLSRQYMGNVVDIEPEKDGSGGALESAASAIGSRSSSDETQAEQLGPGLENRGITTPTVESLLCVRDEPLGEQSSSSTLKEPPPSSTTDQISVDTGTAKGNPQNVEGNVEGAAAAATAPPVSVNETPNTSTAASLIRRSTRSSMGLLKKKSYAESSEDEQASRSNSGGQAAKQKRNDPGGKVLPSTTGSKTYKLVPNTDKPMGTVPASVSTPMPVRTMPDWEVQLRKMPNWEFELEMWKERELFRCSTTGHWDHRPFIIEAPLDKKAEVAKLRVNGGPIPANQLGYNLPWEMGAPLNSAPSTGSNPPQTSVSVHQDIRSSNVPQRTENPLTLTPLLPSKPPIPAPASVQQKASASIAKTAVRASLATSGRRTKNTKKATLMPKGSTVDGKESHLGVRLEPSTPWSLSKPEALNSISHSSTQPVKELLATRPRGIECGTGLGDNEMENDRPKESPAKGRTDGANCAKPTTKRKRKDGSGQDVEGISPLRKTRKVGVSSGSTPKDAEAAVHHRCNARSEVGVSTLLSREDARLIPHFRHNHYLNNTTATSAVAQASIDVLSTPAPPPSGLGPSVVGKVDINQKSISSISSLERTETPHAIAGAGPIIGSSVSALRGGQTLQGTPPTGAAKKRKCLALRFFDSQLERRRDNGEAEKTRLLDAISWLSDLTLDPNKAEIGAEGVVFKGEYAENLVAKLDEKIPITLWRKGLRLVIELADGTTTPLEPTVTQTHADVALSHPVNNTLLTGKSRSYRFPKERPIDPASHWPVLAFCASNRRMIMDEPKQEAQRIIHLLNTMCDVQLEDEDWTLEEAFSRKAGDGSEVVVPRVTIVAAHAREKIFTAFSPKTTKKLAKSNILIFTDGEPFLWKPDQTNFGTLRTIPPTLGTEPPFVSVSIPSIHPNPVFRPHCWVSSDEAAITPGLAFHNMGDYGNGAYQYCHDPLMPMNEADWRDMARPLKFDF